MSHSPGHSLLGALLFTVLGIVELWAVARFVYPGLRRHHELAKVTQTQKLDPHRIMDVVRLQTLVLFPVIGFMMGPHLFGGME